MLPATTGNLPRNPNALGKEESTCPTTEAMQGALRALRALPLLVRYDALGLSRLSPSYYTYDGNIDKSFGRRTYCYRRACPGKISRRVLSWKSRTSSNVSLFSLQCTCSPLNLGASIRIHVRLHSKTRRICPRLAGRYRPGT